MLFNVFIKSLKISIREWKYFLLLSSGIFINFQVFYLKEHFQSTYKILAYALAFIYTLFMIVSSFSLWGRVTRYTYNLPLYSILENIKHSLYSALIFIAYVTILGTTMHFVLTIIESIILKSFLLLIFFALLISGILEVLKVFFLEKEIFSLVDIFSRILTLRFWTSYFLLVIFITFSYYTADIILSYLNNLFNQSSWFKLISSIIRSLVSGYTLITSIVFFITVFDLQKDSELIISDDLV